MAVADRAAARGRADLRDLLAVDLLRKCADRDRGRRSSRWRRWRSRARRRPACADWPGFALFTVALSSLIYGLIESSQRSFSYGPVLGCLKLAGSSTARRLRHRRAAQYAPDVRQDPVQAAHLQRRCGRGIRAQRLDLLDAALSRAVPAGHLLYLPPGTGVRLMVISGGILVTSTVAGRLTSRSAGPAGRRARPDRHRRRAAAHARARRELCLDSSRPGNDRGRRWRRHRQSAAGFHRGRCGATAAGWHGVGHQFHLPSGRDCNRHGPVGDAVRKQREKRRCSPGWPQCPDCPAAARGSPRRCSPAEIGNATGWLPGHAR